MAPISASDFHWRPRLGTALLVSAVLLSSAGCETLRGWGGLHREPPAAVLDADTQTLVGAVSYLNWYEGLPEPNRAEVLARIEREYKQAPTELNRFRLALLLCLPDSASRDLGRARALLEERSAEGAPSAARPLRRVLLGLIDENRQLSVRLATAGKDVERRQATIDELEEKLDSLLQVEKGLQPQPPVQHLPPPERGS